MQYGRRALPHLVFYDGSEGSSCEISTAMRSHTESAFGTRSMDFLSLNFRSLKLEDVKSKSKENLRQVERDNFVERKDRIEEQRCRTKSGKEKSHDKLPTIHLHEVAWHDALDNCWLVIHDYVYDVTDFLKSHSGGQDVILEYAGRDATLAFIGTGHSTIARKTLDQYKIGELPPEERIFRVPDGVKITGF